MHPGRLVVVAGSVTAAVALLFPFVSFPVIGPVDGFDGDAWPAVALLAPAMAAAVLGDRRVAHRIPVGIPMLLLCAGAVVFAAAKAADAVSAVRAAGGDAALGVGPWVLLIGTVAAAIGEVLALLLPPR